MERHGRVLAPDHDGRTTYGTACTQFGSQAVRHGDKGLGRRGALPAHGSGAAGEQGNQQQGEASGRAHALGAMRTQARSGDEATHAMTVHDVARRGADRTLWGIMASMTARYQSTKVFQGFSTAFRQWRAEGTHCAYLHGYDVFFKVWFEGEPDHRNWVWDFGGMSRCQGTIDGMSPRAWMDHLLDHTVLAAEDDPELDMLRELDRRGVLQLRVLPAVGAEALARHLQERLDAFVAAETAGRVRVVRVEFFENERNSAIYEP